MNFLNYRCDCAQLSGKVKTVMEKLDPSGTENNYMGLNELINVIIIFMTFYLNVTFFLIFAFQIREPFPFKLIMTYSNFVNYTFAK